MTSIISNGGRIEPLRRQMATIVDEKELIERYQNECSLVKQGNTFCLIEIFNSFFFF